MIDYRTNAYVAPPEVDVLQEARESVRRARLEARIRYLDSWLWVEPGREARASQVLIASVAGGALGILLVDEVDVGYAFASIATVTLVLGQSLAATVRAWTDRRLHGRNATHRCRLSLASWVPPSLALAPLFAGALDAFPSGFAYRVYCAALLVLAGVLALVAVRHGEWTRSRAGTHWARTLEPVAPSPAVIDAFVDAATSAPAARAEGTVADALVEVAIASVASAFDDD